MTVEQDAVTNVAGLMALAARTAPKAKGTDTITTKVLDKKGILRLAARLEALGKEQGIGFFLRDAKNIAAGDALLLIGSTGDLAVGVNCGACGYPNCAEMIKARKMMKKRTTAFAGPNCAIRMTDLGIAIGSAVKTAQFHNVDNRVMYSAGVAAIDLGLLGKKCMVAYAIPLSATGKNIFFDRESTKK
jgi:uncharacterized ferredoxin-like protein